MAGPLAHVRVLDLSRILAAPYAGQVLADLGADVIKVERPGVGDDTRSWGPPFLKNREGFDTKEAGYYLAVNRGKRSITLDLESAEGQRIVKKLAARSDIVLENYKVGNLARFGLAYADLKAVNPRIIYCSVTGFGQDGPRAEVPAYDFVIQAMAGHMSVTGERDDRPGGGPQKYGVPLIDVMSGMYAAVAVLAALNRREVSGHGEYIDIGMLDVGVASLLNQAMNHLVSGNTPKRAGNAHPNIQPQDMVRCRDGEIVIVVGNEGQFEKFAGALGHPEWTRDPRFSSNAERLRHQVVLLQMIGEVMIREDRAHWVTKLGAAGVPCGPINRVPEVFQDPQVIHRRTLQQLEHPLSGSVPTVASPMRFTEAPIEHRRAPPLLGQHSDEILRELGLDDAEIRALHQSGTV